MRTLRLFLFSILFLPSFAESQHLSVSERMNFEIKGMIRDLKMSKNVQTKFIKIYKKYGIVMIKAKQSGMSKWGLYKVFLEASRERDVRMIEILNAQQYNVYRARQKIIDKMASNLK